MAQTISVNESPAAISAQISSGATSDAQAIDAAAQSMQALTHGVVVSDITLSGIATQTAGSWKTTGTAIFQARGTAESRADFAASSQMEIRALDTSGNPAGVWVKADSVKHDMALHNTFTDAAWFFPALTSLSAASQPGVIAKYIGAETHNGVAVQHVRLWRTADASQAALAGVIPRLSTVDFYLDANSSLPVALAFTVHSDQDMNTDVPVEVRYSDYRAANGIQAPFHVQKYLNRALVMDFHANQVSINSGLTDAQFE